MGLKLPNILLIHFLLPHATAPEFLENTSLVAGLTLLLVTLRLPITTSFHAQRSSYASGNTQNPNFLPLSHVTGLTLPLVDTETSTVLSTSTFMHHDPHIVYRGRDMQPIFGTLQRSSKALPMICAPVSPALHYRWLMRTIFSHHSLLVY